MTPIWRGVLTTAAVAVAEDALVAAVETGIAAREIEIVALASVEAVIGIAAHDRSQRLPRLQKKKTTRPRRRVSALDVKRNAPLKNRAHTSL